MTVAANSPINSYVGNASASVFSFTFPVFLPSQILVTFVNSSTGATSTGILGTDYSVSGLNASGDPASTGSITLINSGQVWLSGGNLNTGYTLVIQSNFALAQSTSIRNQGDFYRSALEDALDNLEYQIQQLELAIGSQLILPTGLLPSAFSPILPSGLPASPGLAIVVNAAGNGFALGAGGSVTIPVSIAQGGTNSTTALTNGKVMQSSGGKIVESTLGISNGQITGVKAPTVQKFTSSSGTYTTPTAPTPLYIRVKMVGGGGGGGGSGTTAGTAGQPGGNTTFGTTLLVANGGGGGQNASAGSSGGTGGTASLGSGPIGTALSGGDGSGNTQDAAGVTNYQLGSTGGANPLGGAGAAGAAGAIGGNGKSNTGGGGGGAGTNNVSVISTGSGGGAGGYIDAIITSPAASYSYAVGAGGVAGVAGTSGQTGGTGGSGYIVVEEFYQ